MDETLARKLRFSDVVYAIETTPKALRNWLQRKQVPLETPETDGGWRDFSFSDIAILVLVRALLDFGIGVVDAGKIAKATIQFFPLPAKPRFKKPEETPVFALSIVWSNSRLLVYRTPDGWQLQRRLPWEKDEPSNIYIVLDVEQILDRAFERALESNTEGAIDDEDDAA